MDIFRSIRVRALLAFLLVGLVGSIVGASLVMARDSSSGGKFEAEVSTGVNRLFGNAVLKFEFMPDPFKDGFGFEMLGVIDPDTDVLRPLEASDEESMILRSFYDVEGAPLTPPPGEGPAGEGLVNVPLQQIATWVIPESFGDLSTRNTLPPHLSGPVVGPTLAEPSAPITKGDWFNASGKMEIKCSSKGNSVKIKVKDLVPNRVYTVWALWLGRSVPGGFIPVPLGGVPNSYVTDKKGNATYERELNFCPTDAAKKDPVGDELTLAIIGTHLHSDHVAYGGIPAPLFQGFSPGTVVQEHLSWDMGAGVPASE